MPKYKILGYLEDEMVDDAANTYHLSASEYIAELQEGNDRLRAQVTELEAQIVRLHRESWPPADDSEYKALRAKVSELETELAHKDEVINTIRREINKADHSYLSMVLANAETKED